MLKNNEKTSQSLLDSSDDMDFQVAFDGIIND
jgi:hypothetical protein